MGKQDTPEAAHSLASFHKEVASASALLEASASDRHRKADEHRLHRAAWRRQLVRHLCRTAG